MCHRMISARQTHTPPIPRDGGCVEQEHDAPQVSGVLTESDSNQPPHAMCETYPSRGRQVSDPKFKNTCMSVPFSRDRGPCPLISQCSFCCLPRHDPSNKQNTVTHPRDSGRSCQVPFPPQGGWPFVIHATGNRIQLHASNAHTRRMYTARQPFFLL